LVSECRALEEFIHDGYVTHPELVKGEY